MKRTTRMNRTPNTIRCSSASFKDQELPEDDEEHGADDGADNGAYAADVSHHHRIKRPLGANGNCG